MKFMSKRVILYFFFLICIYHISNLRVESTEIADDVVAVTEKSLFEVGKNVMVASKMLEYASLSLRSAYVKTDSSVWSFVNLRRSVTNEAKVYSSQILPIATTLVQNLQEFFEYYDVLSLDEFKENLHELINEAEENYKFSKYVLELHKAIHTEFKKLGGQAEIVLRELKMEARRYEEKQNKFRREVKEKDNLALGLGLIPIINIIAVPILANERENIIAQEIAASEEKELAVAAARAIKETLVESIDAFITAIGGITQFFGVLNQELKSFSGKHEKFKKKQLEMHFKVIKKKAATLVSACRFFMSKVPEFETNLMAIPNNHDQNYVQKWLSKKEVEINGEKISFLEWGKKWFGSNTEIADLLGLPSNNDNIRDEL